MLTETFDFTNKGKDLKVNYDRYMVSFDVESLFTNEPTTKTIELILDLAFKKTETFHELNRDELRELLTICVQQSHFQFNGNYFDQIDGVAMGSPLGPFFANVFMSNFEREHMSELRKLGVKRWSRYVDDVLATLGKNKLRKYWLS